MLRRLWNFLCCGDDSAPLPSATPPPREAVDPELLRAYAIFESAFLTPAGKPTLDLIRRGELCLDLKHLRVSKCCAICLVELRVGDRGVPLSCGHVFHTECVLQWLASHSTCPQCRKEVLGAAAAHAFAEATAALDGSSMPSSTEELDKLPISELTRRLDRLGVDYRGRGVVEKPELVALLRQAVHRSPSS
eukprot:RCo052964